MAFQIGNLNPQISPEFIGVPTFRTLLDNQSVSNIGTISFAASVKAMRAVIFMKTYTTSGASGGPQFCLQLSDNAAFTVNTNTIGVLTLVDTASSTFGPQTGIVYGVSSTASGQAFGRVFPRLSGVSSVSFDAIVDAA